MCQNCPVETMGDGGAVSGADQGPDPPALLLPSCGSGTWRWVLVEGWVMQRCLADAETLKRVRSSMY